MRAGRERKQIFHNVAAKISFNFSASGAWVTMLENHENNAASFPFAWQSGGGHLLASRWQNRREPLAFVVSGNSWQG